MRMRTIGQHIIAILAAATLVAAFGSGASASAEPDNSPPGYPHAPSPAGPLAVAPPPIGMPPAQPSSEPLSSTTGQNPLPFTGEPPFVPPTFNPINGSTVGVAKPIVINFARPIGNRAIAEDAIHISSVPPVPGKFYWMSDAQVRWRPIDFWPAGTTVDIDAGGTKSSFRVGESLIATVDDNTKLMEIVRDGELVKTFPVSLGKPGWETPNGTYYVLANHSEIVMDSSTFGLRVDAPEGYRVDVEDAVRISNDGIFVHGAPWSVGAQGESNVSHGCINLSPANAQWFFDNFGSGDPVVVKNTTGGLYTKNDGAQDWQI